MAKFFKYKTADQLLADSRSRQLSIELLDQIEPLFSPIEVGDRPVGNRLCVQPMEGCDGDLDGIPTDLTFRRYQRFGSGGAKLIWGEAVAVSRDGRMNPRQLWLHPGSASSIASMLTLCRDSHRAACGTDHDLLLGLQLTHSGRFSVVRPQLVAIDPLLDPLTIDRRTGAAVIPHAALLSDQELEQIQQQFIAAAILAADIGCDFVDIKQCHRYLLSELLAAKHRPGRFGGSFENRTRFVREVIAEIKRERPQLLVASRFNAYDGIPYRADVSGEPGKPVPHTFPISAFGVDPNDHLQPSLDEPIQLAQFLVAAGVSLLNVSAGNAYANPHVVRPAEFPPIDGYHAPEHPLVGVDRHFRLTAAIQQAVPTTPVVGSGYSWLQEFSMQAGAANIAAGRASFVGLGRGVLSQPDFARQLQMHGKLERTKICRTFSYCTNLMRSKDHPLGQFPTGCPPFDQEIYDPLHKQIQKQKQQQAQQQQ
jgi:NADPH2 dehydrogenase